MFFVYILKSRNSQNHKHLYIGYTDDLKSRLQKHNKGLLFSTKPYLPWQLVYYEAYTFKEEAIKREQNLKLRSNAWNQLKRRIKKSLFINAD